jgi:predicted lipoprotein with Yx(FWY)xxD motif
MLGKRSISTFLLGGTAVAGLALSACGGGNGDGSSSGENASNGSGGTSGHAATVEVADTDLGKILVDSKDRTLYLFLKDRGTTSECSGDCAAAWPPLTASGTPTAGSGAQQSLVGTTTRSDGKSQVTYNGHPVYRFEGDSKAGDTAGEGLVAFGAAWYALSPAGDQVTGKASSSGSSGGGSGY